MKKTLFALSLGIILSLASCGSGPEIPSAQSVVDKTIQEELSKYTDKGTILGEYAVIYQQAKDAYFSAADVYNALFNEAMEKDDNKSREKIIEQRDQIKALVDAHYEPLLVKAAEAIANKSIPCEVRLPLTAATLYIEPFEIKNDIVYNQHQLSIHCNITSSEYVNPTKITMSFYNAENQLVAEIPLKESTIAEGQFATISNADNALEGIRKQIDIDEILSATKVILTQDADKGPRTIF